MNQSLFFISARSRTIFLALASALVTVPPDLTIRNCDNELINRCEMLLREFPKPNRFFFLLAISIFDLLPIFFGLGPHRFVHLSDEKKRIYVEKWLLVKSPLKREFFKGVRGIIMVSYFSHKDIWEYIGYRPTEHIKQRLEMRQQLMHPPQAPDKSNDERTSA